MINEKNLTEVKEFDGMFYKTDDIENAAKVFAGIQND